MTLGDLAGRQAPLRDENGTEAARERPIRSMVSMLIGPDARVRYVSQTLQAVLGHPPSGQVGQSAFELVHPADAPSAYSMFEASLKEPGVPVSVTVRMRHLDGASRDMELTTTHLVSDRDPAAILLTCVDVTDSGVSTDNLRELDNRTERPASAWFGRSPKASLTRCMRRTARVAI
jgi:PAS domain S-box-containing protein